MRCKREAMRASVRTREQGAGARIRKGEIPPHREGAVLYMNAHCPCAVLSGRERYLRRQIGGSNAAADEVPNLTVEVQQRRLCGRRRGAEQQQDAGAGRARGKSL